MNSESETPPKPETLVPYRELVTRLETPFPESGFALNPVQHYHLKQLLALQIMVGGMMDLLKRSIFYGKTPQEYVARMENLKANAESVLKFLNSNLPLSGQGKSLHLTRNDFRTIHGIIGISTEASELCNALFINLFQPSKLDVVNLKEELGDCRWYLELLYDVFGVDDAEIRLLNTKKLLTRYPGKFSAEAALNRDLDAERKVLEDKPDTLMTHYCLGFAFSFDRSQVLLIEKKRPDYQAGKFNGIGGVVQHNESPEYAMTRKSLAEAGYAICGWKKYCVVTGHDYQIHVFMTHMTENEQASLKTVTDEEVKMVPISQLPEKLVHGANWLVPMAQSFNGSIEYVSNTPPYKG